MILNTNYIIPESEANGPGTRFTIWVQGCSIHCPGCSNKDTWPTTGGQEYYVNSLAKDIQQYAGRIDGVTITGGEPLDQWNVVKELLERIRNFSIFLTTGYTIAQIGKMDRGILAADLIDILCTGPFQEDKICSGEWKGSSNQVLHFLTARGIRQSKMPVVHKEVFISSKGNTVETGFTA